jgi:hypothetical protein
MNIFITVIILFIMAYLFLLDIFLLKLISLKSVHRHTT